MTDSKGAHPGVSDASVSPFRGCLHSFVNQDPPELSRRCWCSTVDSTSEGFLLSRSFSMPHIRELTWADGGAVIRRPAHGMQCSSPRFHAYRHVADRSWSNVQIDGQQTARGRLTVRGRMPHLQHCGIEVQVPPQRHPRLAIH